jgi:hypothetical protein
MVLLLAVLAGADVTERRRMDRVGRQPGWGSLALPAVVAASLLFATTTLTTFPAQGPWKENILMHAWHVTLRKSRPPADQRLLDKENILFERLPLWLTTPAKRFYPDNQEVIARLIARGAAANEQPAEKGKISLEFAVVSSDARQIMLDLAQLAGGNCQEPGRMNGMWCLDWEISKTRFLEKPGFLSFHPATGSGTQQTRRKDLPVLSRMALPASSARA